MKYMSNIVMVAIIAITVMVVISVVSAQHDYALALANNTGWVLNERYSAEITVCSLEEKEVDAIIDEVWSKDNHEITEIIKKYKRKILKEMARQFIRRNKRLFVQEANKIKSKEGEGKKE